MRHKEFWIALTFGALAGGIAALLYAPASGAQTRKKLKRSIDDAGDALEDAGDYLKDQAEKLSKEAQKLIERSRDQFDDVVDTANGYVKTAAQAAKAVQKLV
jgi:gas vesicle protein